MKKNIVLTGIILATVVLAVLSVVTAIRIKNLGTQPVAPSAPVSKPKAEVPTPSIGDISPAPECQTTFSVATPTPCSVKIQGRVYRDRSPQADYRVSDSEEFGPTVFRVDYQPEGLNMIINGGNKACVDSCSPACAVNFANGSFATGSLNPGKYAIRLYLNSADWVVSEAYFSNGTACKANKSGNVAVSGLNTQTAYISSVDYSCGTYNIWFGVKPKAEATVTPTSTPTPTGTFTPTPTGTQAPTPTLTNTPVPVATNTPVPASTNTPVPVATSTLPPRFTQPTATPVYRAAVESTPTEILLPETGLKIPTLGGLIMGFLLISLGVALIF